MFEFIVIGYNNQEQVEMVCEVFYKFVKEYLIEVEDVVVVMVEQDGQIKLYQMVNFWVMGVFGGVFWGLFVGFVFFNLLVGVVVGVGVGVFVGVFLDYGINDGFMKDVFVILQLGQVVLFILVKCVILDCVVEEMSKYGGCILCINFDCIQEQVLCDVFDSVCCEVLVKEVFVIVMEKVGDQLV